MSRCLDLPHFKVNLLKIHIIKENDKVHILNKNALFTWMLVLLPGPAACVCVCVREREFVRNDAPESGREGGRER